MVDGRACLNEGDCACAEGWNQSLVGMNQILTDTRKTRPSIRQWMLHPQQPQQLGPREQEGALRTTTATPTDARMMVQIGAAPILCWHTHASAYYCRRAPQSAGAHAVDRRGGGYRLSNDAFFIIFTSLQGPRKRGKETSRSGRGASLRSFSAPTSRGSGEAAAASAGPRFTRAARRDGGRRSLHGHGDGAAAPSAGLEPRRAPVRFAVRAGFWGLDIDGIGACPVP